MSRALVAAVSASLLIQVSVPAVQLRGDDQRRWGWQMYAGRTAVTEILAVDATGDTVHVQGWAAQMRPEIEWRSHAPRHLCQVESVATVRLRFSDGRSEVVSCST